MSPDPHAPAAPAQRPHDHAERQHPAQPPSPAVPPGDDWQPPQALPEVPATPAPLVTAAGLTLLALGAVWPSGVLAVLGALTALIGAGLWARAGLASWRAWLRRSEQP